MRNWTRSTGFALLLIVAGGLVACPTPPPANDDDTPGPDPVPMSDDSLLKEMGVAEPPPLWVEPQNPLPGQQVTIVVSDPTGGPVSASAAGDGCGGVLGGSAVGTLNAGGAVGTSGSCLVTATLIPTDDPTPQTLQRWVHVQASEPVLPPFDVLEGYWFEGPPPGIEDPAAGVISDLTGPSQFINGANIAWTGEIALTDSPRAVIITAPGVAGHFVVPINEDAGARDHGFEFTLSFARDIFDSIPGTTVTLAVQVLDALNRLGPPAEETIQGNEVGQGDVQVGISWDTPTDVDLHVTEPSGETIYYGATTSSTGGQLDLDSNPGCSIDGVNHENVFWPPGQSPSGEYTVMANMFDSCEEGGANGTVTITHCGDDSPIVAAFSLGESGSQSWTFESACESRIKGRIRYEDFSVSRTGLSATGAYVPSRYVTVQVLREDDLEMLAEGTTDASGNYDIAFVNDGIPGVQIQVLSHSEHTRAQQQVLTHAGELYAWISEQVWDESTEAAIEGADLDIDKATDAGALNIYDLALRARARAVAGTGSPVPFSSLYWTAGQRPFGNNYSYYSGGTKGIYVLGDPADTDEYDDFILAHEYGHLVMDRFSKDDSPGGTHSFDVRAVPTLAWSEGWATYFATLATRSTVYSDTIATGIGVWLDLETLPAYVPRGNTGDVMGGNVSEGIITGILLDLSDNTNEAKDGVEQGEMAIWSILTHYLNEGSPWYEDRGAAGRDTVDFLDGWFCFGFGLEGATDSEGVRGIVRGIHGVTYDFGRAECE